MKNNRSMSHNVCYRTIHTINGYPIYGWSVRSGDLVFDSDLGKTGIVEVTLHETLDHSIPAVLYVRFTSSEGDFTARYLPRDCEHLTIVRNALVCDNGVVTVGDSVVLTGYLGSPVGVVTRVEHGDAFVKLPSFGVWASPSEFVKLSTYK